MASIPSYPGVHLREAPSGAETIAGASTSVAAFVGFHPEGPMNAPTRVFSFAEFSRHFGGLYKNSELGYAVRQFFLNGGSEAWIVRVDNGAGAASVTFTYGSSDNDRLTLKTPSKGEWGEQVRAALYLEGEEQNGSTNTVGFHLLIRRVQPPSQPNASGTVLSEEVHRDLDVDPSSNDYFVDRLAAESELVVAEDLVDSDQSPDSKWPNSASTGTIEQPDSGDFASLALSTSGPVPSTTWTNDQKASLANAIIGSSGTIDQPKGFKALADIEPNTFNILCLPDAIHFTQAEPESASSTLQDGHKAAKTVYDGAITFCEKEDVFLLVDPPRDIQTRTDATDLFNSTSETTLPRHKNAATYFPQLEIPDPLANFTGRTVAPSGTMAGLFARTDANRGIWKAPAGTQASLRGAKPVKVVRDTDSGVLNDEGINATRNFAGYGPVCWGARTLVGNQEGDNRYVPVRRMMLYLKQSLELGLKWAVFQPNGERLWSTIRMSVGSFLDRLYRQGAFKGGSANEAYFVLCDSTTTTPDDINRGIVNVVVGFAPLKPAEFVVVTLKQIAGQAQT